jgi:hypothetical protein
MIVINLKQHRPVPSPNVSHGELSASSVYAPLAASPHLSSLHATNEIKTADPPESFREFEALFDNEPRLLIL